MVHLSEWIVHLSSGQHPSRGKMPSKKPSAFAQQPFTRLKQHLAARLAERDVLWEHRLGVLTESLCPRNERRYGTGGIEKLARKLGTLTTANQLWNARKLAVAFTTEQLDSLLNRASKLNFALTRSHILSLIPVKDDSQRDVLGKQCVDQRWSVERLRREIHRLQGKQSKGRAPLAKPESVDDVLHDLLERSKDWLNRCEHLWFANESISLAQPMAGATAMSLQGELLEAESLLKELGKAADTARRGLRSQRLGAAVPISSKSKSKGTQKQQRKFPGSQIR